MLPLPQPVVSHTPQPVVLPVLQLEEKPQDKRGDGKEGENGSQDSHSSDEVEEFYTLLDTTLHLPESSAVRPPLEEDGPLPRVAFCEPEGEFDQATNFCSRHLYGRCPPTRSTPMKPTPMWTTPIRSHQIDWRKLLVVPQLSASTQLLSHGVQKVYHNKHHKENSG